MVQKSDLEESLLWIMHVRGFPVPEREYRFHDVRKWRLDFAWPARKVAVEVQGGTYRKSAHSSMYGLQRDYTKYNTAAIMGWTILQFTGKMIESGEAADTIGLALGETA